jgi:hypothetical protein
MATALMLVLLSLSVEHRAVLTCWCFKAVSINTSDLSNLLNISTRLLGLAARVLVEVMAVVVEWEWRV